VTDDYQFCQSTPGYLPCKFIRTRYGKTDKARAERRDR
jgi:hypothetical protein